MLLIEMLSPTPHPRLAVLSVAIVAANKPLLVKRLTNIPAVVRLTTSKVNNPAGFTVSPNRVLLS
jgi:hypothetical protein